MFTAEKLQLGVSGGVIGQGSAYDACQITKRQLLAIKRGSSISSHCCLPMHHSHAGHRTRSLCIVNGYTLQKQRYLLDKIFLHPFRTWWECHMHITCSLQTYTCNIIMQIKRQLYKNIHIKTWTIQLFSQMPK